MVEDRVSDGKRIAQLLSSELSGRDRGTLGDVTVVDADPDAEPSPEGTVAYGIAYRDERVATVRIYPDAATISVDLAAETVTAAVRGPDLRVVDETDLRIESGAAVKRAVDALVAGLADSE
ncbi:hypothetical protein [Halosimplex salinum]|uniref:hypothetical protein n=1 Tax=Halosimplex salinum TaxID=1710538 RepID=UPI000F480C7E|nr:hypothetical protein [Halosimplex salinum]